MYYICFTFRCIIIEPRYQIFPYNGSKLFLIIMSLDLSLNIKWFILFFSNIDFPRNSCVIFSRLLYKPLFERFSKLTFSAQMFLLRNMVKKTLKMNHTWVETHGLVALEVEILQAQVEKADHTDWIKDIKYIKQVLKKARFII